jgi:hypothetical protein
METGMDDKRLIERLTYVPYDDFVRANGLMASPEDGALAVQQVIDRLRANPDHDFVMGPNFLAVLALFSVQGRAIAEAHMSTDEILQRQRELAVTRPAIRHEFPETVDGNHGQA